jgi:hypothetical protein
MYVFCITIMGYAQGILGFCTHSDLFSIVLQLHEGVGVPRFL